MDTENKDLLLLNALVDGELAPQERAAIAARLAVERDLARAYATLAKLKASIGQIAGELPAILLPPAKRRSRLLVAAAAACITAAIGIGLSVKSELLFNHYAVGTSVEGPTSITLASLPAGTTIPRLERPD